MAGDRVQISTPQVIHESIDGEIIIINLGSGTYYSAKGSGATVWELVHRMPGVSRAELAGAVAARYEATVANVEAAVGDFLVLLREEGLVESVDRAGVPVPDAPPLEPDSVPGPFDPPKLEKYTDMQDLVLLDPVHQVDEAGWPAPRPDVAQQNLNA